LAPMGGALAFIVPTKELKEGEWLPTYGIPFRLSCDCGWKPHPFCAIGCKDIYNGPWYCPNCGKVLKRENENADLSISGEMEDRYIPPKRIEFRNKCPLCGTKIIRTNSLGKDPLGVIYKCPNKDCEIEQVIPNIYVYGCVMCGADTITLSKIDGLPYCMKHLPAYVEITQKV
jgi:endogenous inhibitor of DNA gyrase (YacG/DUF329 family)